MILKQYMKLLLKIGKSKLIYKYRYKKQRKLRGSKQSKFKIQNTSKNIKS